MNIETIVTDQEIGLIESIHKYFPNSQRISCLFHYKQDILRNLKLYGLYKKETREKSNIIVKELGKLPFLYKGDINFIYKQCQRLSEEYPTYYNFLHNYFLVNKISFFKDNSLNYHKVPIDYSSNSFLENYYGYIKDKLGKKRIINWVNFLNFIKEESSRSIEKLLNGANKKIIYSKNKQKKLLINKKDNEKSIYDMNIKDNIKKNMTSFQDEILNYNNISVEDIIGKIFGIYNIGNTCYINSSLQILLHLQNFIQKFIEKKRRFFKKIYQFQN